MQRMYPARSIVYYTRQRRIAEIFFEFVGDADTITSLIILNKHRCLNVIRFFVIFVRSAV
jgi:hypothetical protein